MSSLGDAFGTPEPQSREQPVKVERSETDSVNDERLTVRLPAELKRRLEHAAIDHGGTGGGRLNRLTVRFIEEGVNSLEK